MSEKFQQTHASAITSPLPNFLLFEANHLHMFKKEFKKKAKFFPCEQNQAFGVLYVGGFKPSQEITFFDEEMKLEVSFALFTASCPSPPSAPPQGREQLEQLPAPSSLSLPPNPFLLLNKAEKHPQPEANNKRHL